MSATATASVAPYALTARLRALSRSQLLALHAAAAEAVACAAALAEDGINPVTALVGRDASLAEWTHCPAGDVIDPVTRGQFYYHAHAAEERAAGEHGHFHTFVRLAGPTAIPQADRETSDAAGAAHLIGISADASGRVTRLFTTNRWVTGEAWHDADAVIGMLDRFDITVEQPSAALNRWITAVTRMFRPQIEDLIRARDMRLAQYKVARPDADVLECRDLQVISEMPVDFLAQIRAIEEALRASPATSGAATSPPAEPGAAPASPVRSSVDCR